MAEVDQEGRGVEVEHVSDISGATSEASGNTGTKNKRITPNVGMSVCYDTHTHTHTHTISISHLYIHEATLLHASSNSVLIKVNAYS